MNNIPLYINTFIQSNIKFINDLYEENYKKSDKKSHGLIYIKIIEEKLDLAYITYNDLIENEIIEKNIVNNIKKEYESKKVIYINKGIENYILLL